MNARFPEILTRPAPTKAPMENFPNNDHIIGRSLIFSVTNIQRPMKITLRVAKLMPFNVFDKRIRNNINYECMSLPDISNMDGQYIEYNILNAT